MSITRSNYIDIKDNTIAVVSAKNVTFDIKETKNIIESSSLLTTIIGGVAVIFVVFIVSKLWKKIIRIFKSIFILLFKKEAFEVLGLRKHITICANGHLIVLHDFKLKINKKDNSEKFTRMFDVSDGADKCRLPIIKDMLNTDKKERFHSYGFWYRSNPEDIFEEVKEVDQSKNSYKHRNFYFRFNKSSLKNFNRKTIKLMYGYSVKYGQPLTNGYYDYSLISDKSREPSVISQFKVQYKMDSLEYIFSFIDSVHIQKNEIKAYYYPDGIDNAHTKEEYDLEQKDDLYYNKFVFKIEKPKFNSMIQIIAPVKVKDT